MSRSHIEALRRQLSAAEATNDGLINKLRGIIAFNDKALTDLAESSDAIIAVVNERRADMESRIQQVNSEVQKVIAELSGAPKVIDQPAQPQLQAAE